MLEFITWIVFGGFVGWLASVIMRTDDEQGIIADIVIGVLGAIIGGFIARVVFDHTVGGFNLTSFIVALVGAILLVSIGKILTRKT
jgi:uncharacterized membrane protein YeaQ/YmgE (transglycosylase-associated protein family)